ncbi:hypothetical protein HYZ64_00455 [Candidatus Berkelbacteria bacterium]|nr:hypothetical protein [Candidatus Berkelbacteria bacterium]
MKKAKLDHRQREQFLLHFCRALAEIHKPEEAAAFIQDLLSKGEAEMLAKRLEIAHHLMAGNTYEEIKESLNASYGTIARVNLWLETSGEGYRLIVNRLKRYGEKDEIAARRPSWRSWKRKYPMYYWPELLLEEIIVSANKRQRERIDETLKKLNRKDQLTKKLRHILGQASLSGDPQLLKNVTIAASSQFGKYFNDTNGRSK